jgi:hypothetical protein
MQKSKILNFCGFSQPKESPKKGASPSTARTPEATTKFGIFDPFSTPAPPTTPSNEPG